MIVQGTALRLKYGHTYYDALPYLNPVSSRILNVLSCLSSTRHPSDNFQLINSKNSRKSQSYRSAFPIQHDKFQYPEQFPPFLIVIIIQSTKFALFYDFNKNKNNKTKRNNIILIWFYLFSFLFSLLLLFRLLFVDKIFITACVLIGKYLQRQRFI